jgi:serine phosphatase RsbU (regulator of sigma subunit)
MKRLNCLLLGMAGITLAVLMFVGCSKGRQELKPCEKTYTHADTLYQNAIKEVGDSAVLVLLDSLEDEHALSQARADFYRGKTYRRMGESDKAIEYFDRVIEEAGSEDYWCYQVAGENLCQALVNKGDFDLLVKKVIPILSTVDSIGYTERASQIFMRTMLGTGNLRLGKEKKAKELFDRVGADCEAWLAEDTTGEAVDCAIDVYNNIATFYFNESKVEEAEPWVERHKALLPEYKRIAEKDHPDMVQRHYISSYFHRLDVCDYYDKADEAEKILEEYKKLDVGQSDFGRIHLANYMLQHDRFAEAADNLDVLDRFMHDNNMELTLDNLILYTNKLGVNVDAGRTDTALYVAEQVAVNYPRVLRSQRENDAIKLATIYDTQGKEREIAEQKAKIQQQRIVGLIVAIILLTIFFVIYTLVRRRAAKRLAEMKAAQERIESELRIARDIQMSMVPSQFPDYDGLDMYASMTPAKEVGGDLYGYVLIGDKLYFAIGDVSGKGVPASLFMAQATRLFRTLAAQQMMPAEICTRMNEALSGDDNESSMFVTFFLGLIDLTTGHLDFCNAGHNPPIIGGGEHQGDFLDMIPNAPIGLFPGLEYEGEQIDSIEGRPLFIYTDGLNEAEDPEQNQFGDDRLLDILRTTHFDSAREVIDTLKSEVEKHRNGAEPNDDLTMMCLRVNLQRNK